MASKALRTFQRAMDVTGHNVSNVNTRGYSRQTVDISTDSPLLYFQMGNRSLGNGASITSINRVRDQFLDTRMQSALSDQGKNSGIAASLEGILGTMNEPNDGSVSKALGGFYNAWSALASNPNESANRTQVQLAGAKLGSTIRGIYKDLNMQSENIAVEVKNTVATINSISESLSQLNAEIRSASTSGVEPSDLLDRRDQLLEDLSGLVNITVTRQQDGTTNVYASNSTLVDGVGSYDLPSDFNAATGNLVDGTDEIPIRSGKLAGLLAGANRLDTQITNLNNLANTIRTEVNNIHKSGLNPNGTTNVNFFNDVLVGPQTGAVDFGLSTEVETDTKNIATGVTNAAGDNGLALQLSQLRSTKIAALGNRSMLDFHKDNVAAVGSEHNYFQGAADTTAAITEQIENQRQAISGVSLDDEMSNMLKYQKSYQAAAKMVSIFDEMAQDLIGMLR